MGVDAPARLREERTRLGFNQVDFGKLGGVSKNTQLAYENGSSPIPLDYLQRQAEHGLDLVYVASGLKAASSGLSTAGPSGEDAVEIGQIDLRFGLGGAIMDEEIGEQQVEKLSFPRAWLRMITASPPSQLYWARGQGNSMEPAISDGEVILIDRSQVTLGFGDLYWAFAYGQTGMVKRLRQMPDGSVKILSDNPSVPPEIAYDGELHLFGRVVAVVRRL